jgi:CHAD domain-containing protein
VLRKGSQLGHPVSADALHRLRIECKKLRYLLSFFRGFYPVEEMNLLIRDLKELQDHLGRFNDLRVQGGTLGRLAGELLESGEGPPQTFLAIGKVMGRLEAEKRGKLEVFHQYYQGFSCEENQKRFEALFHSDGD